MSLEPRMVVLLCTSSLLLAHAHVGLTAGASSGPYFSSLDTALNTSEAGELTGDMNGTAFFANRVAFCAWPYLWMSFHAPVTNYTLMVGGTVPVIERFQDVRVAVGVVGPGLPIDGVSQLPAEVQAQVPAGMGAIAVPGVRDTSNCSFLNDPLSMEAYSVRYNDAAPSAVNFSWGPRCFYHEYFTSVDMWIVQDALTTLSSTGSHHHSIAIFPDSYAMASFLNRHPLRCLLGAGRPAARRAQDHRQVRGPHRRRGTARRPAGRISRLRGVRDAARRVL